MTARRPAKDEGPADDRSDGLPTAEPVIETFERFAERYGLNRSCGRIYGICCFASEPQSLDDLVSASGYAKSTVSTATQTLTRLSLLSRRSGRDGSQRVSFRAETDITAVVQDLVRRRVARDFDELRAAVAKGRAQSSTAGTGDHGDREREARRNTPAALQADIERIEGILQWVSELSEDQFEAISAEIEGNEDEEPNRRRAPGFYPRLGR